MIMPIQIDGEAFLSTVEACESIGVSRETLNKYVNNGLIKRYKRGLGRVSYYKQSEVEELIRKRAEIREEG